MKAALLPVLLLDVSYSSTCAAMTPRVAAMTPAFGHHSRPVRFVLMQASPGCFRQAWVESGFAALQADLELNQQAAEAGSWPSPAEQSGDKGMAAITRRRAFAIGGVRPLRSSAQRQRSLIPI